MASRPGMHDAPDPQQMLDAVQHYLRDELPAALRAPGATPEALAFHSRVAANLLAIAQRQLAEPPAVAAAERLRLQQLLASDETDLPVLTRLLCDQLQAGRIGAETPGLADHLWATTLAKLAVDQPRYATYRRHADGAPHADRP